MQFQREATPKIFAELKPLLEKHWREVAHFQDIPLEPDWETYENLDNSGALRTYTVRTLDGVLVGYAIYFVRSNPHYKSSIQASQDILFMDPAYRGKGGRFIKWCDEQLKADGVQAVYQHVKAKHNFGPLLERIGYQLVDLIYARRLD